jgi:hypothetical protein
VHSLTLKVYRKSYLKRKSSNSYRRRLKLRKPQKQLANDARKNVKGTERCRISDKENEVTVEAEETDVEEEVEEVIEEDDATMKEVLLEDSQDHHLGIVEMTIARRPERTAMFRQIASEILIVQEDGLLLLVHVHHLVPLLSVEIDR